MTDINTRGKLPFAVVSSSVTTGYAAELTSSVGYNIDIVNLHRDEYGGIENSPLQGPFTQQHVGGNQHRHIKLNEGNDNSDNRPEGYVISASAGSVKVYGPDVKGIHKPRSILTRDTTAKSPINIKNIATSGNIAGNFEHNYQVVQSVGRRTTNNLINDNFIASGNLTTQFIAGTNNYSLPEIDNNSKSIFVERFNAPGSKEASSRGALDREGEEYSPNNSLVTRNIKVRQPYYDQLTQHNKKFYLNNEIPFCYDIDIKLSGSFYVGGLENSPLGFYFKEDGTEFYHVGFQNKTVRRYKMSIPFKIDTALIFGSGFNVSSQETTPRGITFSPDGSNMFVVGTRINRYNLSTPWNITTAVFNSNFNPLGTSTGILFDSSGTRFFTSTTSSIKEYTLATPWDITTSVLKSTLDISEWTLSASGFSFDSSGLELFIVSTSGHTILKFSLTSNKELTNATYVSSRLIDASEESTIQDIYITPQKDKLFIIGSELDSVSQYDLDTTIFGEHSVNRNSLETIEEYNGYYITSSVSDNLWVQHAIPRTDLRYKWIADSVSSSQQPIEYQSYQGQYSRDGAFSDIEFELTGPFGDHLGISGAIDKDEMFVSTYTNTMYRDRKYLNFTSSNDFYVDASSIASEISEKDFTISFWMKTSGNIPSFAVEKSIFEISKTVAAEDNVPQGLFFHPSGTFVYFVGSQNDRAYRRDLSIPWDITDTGSLLSSPVLSGSSVPRGLYIKPDGTTLYVILSSPTTEILEFPLPTPWSITTLGTVIKWPFSNDAGPRDIFFKPDGTKIYICGDVNNRLYEKTLSTPWVLSTTGSAVTLNSPSTGPHAVSFSEDGKHLYLLDRDSGSIYYYYLSTAWDITSAVLLSDNTLSISSYETMASGLFINERQKKLYFVGESGDDINQFSLIEQPLSLIEYSGSVSDNKLLLNVNFSSSYLTVSGSGILNSNLALPKIEDGNWHFITLVSDLTSQSLRITENTSIAIPSTKIKVYVDGGLVEESEQPFKKIDVSKLLFSIGRNKEKENGQLDEIMIWDSFLTEEQINEIYRTSKPEYGQQPKKYIEHKLTNTSAPQPLHVYSSRTDDITNIMFDEVGNKNATLTNYAASVNLRPQNNGIISYSTYFNGPYQGASWKSIRNAEHPVTRKLTTENTNIVSVVVPEAPREIFRTKTVNGNPIQIRLTLPPSRKQGTILNVKESPVYINNKPLKHKFILKDSTNPNVGFELTHTYGNNLQYFANQQLNDTLGLGKKERQIYDTLFDYYNGNVEQNENPIQRLVGYTYSETVFPKSGQALLKDVRQRTDYITDEPGYGPDGYDKQLGTQRVFWRDNQEDRMRTPNSYINSLGNQVSSYYTDLPALTPSVAALEFISESKNVEIYKEGLLTGAEVSSSIVEFNYKNSSELNSLQNINEVSKFQLVPGFDVFSYRNEILPSSQYLELNFFKNKTFISDLVFSQRENFNAVRQDISNYPNLNLQEPSSFKISPKYIYEHPSVINGISGSAADLIAVFAPDPPPSTNLQEEIYNNFTHDLGLNRVTEKESGKNPWYDSYENYYIDVKNLSNDYLKTYSKIPEFKISDSITKLVNEYGGDESKIQLTDYDTTSKMEVGDLIQQQNNNFCEQNTIKIKVNGVKKLLPYNGFYPQDRSLQLVNYLKQSYLDTNAIKGGLLLIDGSNSEPFYDEEDKLVENSKQSAFLEPFFAPGIFYNLIKSGIAVSWNVYTGSIPTNGASPVITPTRKLPDFRIDFESLINLAQIVISSSTEQNSNRILKMKEYSLEFGATDYDAPSGQVRHYQSFFERTEKGSNLYTLSINNFLAETINFFLKDSKLNSFISKPDSDFNFDNNKTYYMDVVLKKKDVIMCEAHSSSLAYNFGKMSGRYFGPAFWTGSSGDLQRINDNLLLAEALRDPGYCMYTPPYYYGDAIARLSFKPPSGSRKYTLDEIFNNLKIENMNTAFMDNSVYSSGSLYSTFAMPVGSSVTLNGVVEARQQTVELSTAQLAQSTLANLRNNLVGSATNISGIKKWVISPKMEVPVLDFSNQEFVTSTTILTQSFVDQNLKTIFPQYTPPTASGFGRGMWSGYGEIPTEDKGIFVELRESYPRQLVGRLDPVTRTFTETNTGSLLQVCGFDQVNSELSKKIGEIADSKEISEAIVVIPYSDNTRSSVFAEFDEGSFLPVNDTVQIEGHNFFKIEEGMFNTQLQNILSGKSALIAGNYGVRGEIKETSISNMIKSMQKYVLPPNFDFLINRNIKPFVMYIAEFTSTLDKQDLADVWQGLMPKIATRAEREEQIISHENSLYDFFHGKGLPKDVKFMIFKAKKRAQINYYKMTADSRDDGLFPEIQVGKGPSPYSFNWPYDYCSLVETAKVDVEIEYISGSNNI